MGSDCHTIHALNSALSSQSSGFALMDPLSDVLSLLKPRSYMSGGFDFGAPMAIRFGPHEGIKCYAVVSGEGWLSVEGEAEPVRLGPGDCFLLPSGRPFSLATGLGLTPVDAHALLADRQKGVVRTINGGGECFIVGGFFTLAAPHARMLLSMLPPIVHIREEAARAALRWSVEQMMQELREPRPGGTMMAQHLTQMMLVQALRVHLAEGPDSRGGGAGVGWLFALADRRMAAAIGAIHDDPAHGWTVATLAGRAGMSRSTFALRFKEKVGASPMDYLTRWRMLLAGDRLENSGEPVSVIARTLGYESESAFSTAFKRVMGCSPRRYGLFRRSAAAPPGWQESSAARAEQMAVSGMG
jgi:AraC-like DNA-binding protein